MARRIPNIKAKSHFKQRLIFGLVIKPLRLFCEHCDKYIPSDMPWQCSHCDFENTRTRFYSFLHKCQECKRAPKSYVCPHCGSVNFLDMDSDASHPACKAARYILPEPVVDIQEQKQKEHEDRKQDLVREIELTRLNGCLAQLKTSPEFQEKLSEHESLEKSFSEHDAHVMGAYMIEKEQRTKNAERYKDDPEMLERANDSLTQWIEKQL